MSDFSFWSKTYSKFVKKYYMEAIKAIAKRMKTRIYKIDLPFDTNAAAIRVMLIVEIDKKKHSRVCR